MQKGKQNFILVVHNMLLFTLIKTRFSYICSNSKVQTQGYDVLDLSFIAAKTFIHLKLKK